MYLEDISYSIVKIQIKKGECFELLGTGVCLPVIDYRSPDDQFIITNRHVVIEAKVKKQDIYISNIFGEFTLVEMLYPNSNNIINTIYQDIAILKLRDSINITTSKCKKINSECDVIIKGFPSGLTTECTILKGTFIGSEIEKISKKEILTLLIPDLRASFSFNYNNKILKSPFEFWSGISGSPIYIKCSETNRYYCIGIFSGIEEDVVGNRCYGIKIDSIIDKVKELGLELIDEPNKNSNKDIFESGIIEITEGLIEEEREKYFWDWISNLFYKGNRIDFAVRKFVELNDDINDKVILYYYLSILSYKIGDINNGNKLNYLSYKLITSSSPEIKHRFKNLLKIRFEIENFGQRDYLSVENILTYSNCIKSFTSCSDEYIVLKLGSMFGRTLTLFFNNFKLHKDSSVALENLIHEHALLIEQNPVLLKKQDVANTLLEILILLWKPILDIDKAFLLSPLIAKGYRQALTRRNSIFYVQMFISKTIYLLLIKEYLQSYFNCLIISTMFVKLGLKLSHEGINQLLIYLKQHFNKYYNLIIVFGSLTESEKISLIKNEVIFRTSEIKVFSKKLRTVEHIIKGKNEFYKLEENQFQLVM
jgi:hypothetical protein